MTSQILIVDGDEAFATILKEGIEMGGEHRASIATSGAAARDAAAQERLSMAIVDMGLEDETPLGLMRFLRDQDPNLRLMIIPLDEPSEEVLALGVQGTLPKPFFLPDIPSQIEEALSRPIPLAASPATPEESAAVELATADGAEVAAPATPGEATMTVPAPTALGQLPAHLTKESQRLTDHLHYLSRELNADAVLLTFGTELVAYAGHFGRAEAERLALVVSDSWQASVRVAAALGREKVRFEQSLHEGEDYLLYSVAAAQDIVLSVALRADRPLGMIRYNTKQTAQELRPLLLPR